MQGPAVKTQSCKEITAGMAKEGNAAFKVCFTAKTSLKDVFRAPSRVKLRKETQYDPSEAGQMVVLKSSKTRSSWLVFFCFFPGGAIGPPGQTYWEAGYFWSLRKGRSLKLDSPKWMYIKFPAHSVNRMIFGFFAECYKLGLKELIDYLSLSNIY